MIWIFLVFLRAENAQMESRIHINDDIDEEKKREQTTCTYPNTVPGYRGECMCDHGYVGDMPITERGCWKCDPECNSQAICEYPGRCICQGGLIGDGTNTCDAPIPELVKLDSANSATSLPTILLYFRAPFDFIPFMAFCQFDQREKVAGMIHMNRSIECLVPKNITRKTMVRLSFNGFNWTNEVEYANLHRGVAAPRRTPVEIVRTKKPKKIEKSYVSPAYLIGFVAITCILCGWMMIDTKKEKSSDEPMVQQKQSEKQRHDGVRSRVNV